VGVALPGNLPPLLDLIERRLIDQRRPRVIAGDPIALIPTLPDVIAGVRFTDGVKQQAA